jgi:general L-amino acid transport system ATP-binding protein
MADAIIRMQDVNKWFGKFHVLRNINLEVAPGERIVICGPSGSGKSTLIRCINRLEEHQRGRIVVEGTEITNDIRHVEAIRRDVGMVFQHFNLFPHLTVLENLTLGPIWVLKTPKAEAEARAAAEKEERRARRRAEAEAAEAAAAEARSSLHIRLGDNNHLGREQPPKECRGFVAQYKTVFMCQLQFAP